MKKVLALSLLILFPSLVYSQTITEDDLATQAHAINSTYLSKMLTKLIATKAFPGYLHSEFLIGSPEQDALSLTVDLAMDIPMGELEFPFFGLGELGLFWGSQVFTMPARDATEVAAELGYSIDPNYWGGNELTGINMFAGLNFYIGDAGSLYTGVNWSLEFEKISDQLQPYLYFDWDLLQELTARLDISFGGQLGVFNSLAAGLEYGLTDLVPSIPLFGPGGPQASDLDLGVYFSSQPILLGSQWDIQGYGRYFLQKPSSEAIESVRSEMGYVPENGTFLELGIGRYFPVYQEQNFFDKLGGNPYLSLEFTDLMVSLLTAGISFQEDLGFGWHIGWGHPDMVYFALQSNYMMRGTFVFPVEGLSLVAVMSLGGIFE